MRRVAVDWDGTCVYDHHWPNMGWWLPGAIQALQVLAYEFDEVVIWTCRYAWVDTDEVTLHDPTSDRRKIERRLRDADLPSNVTVWTQAHKPPAEFYIDNKALRFEGDWKEVLKQVYATGRDTTGTVRVFETGATRDTDDGKLDYEGFFSPTVLRRRAEYMHSHRVQSDGTLRASDNWQKGIPVDQYMKSMWRHFMEVWLLHREAAEGDLEEALAALAFNVDGMLHEVLKARA